jgi:hypothetical protein
MVLSRLLGRGMSRLLGRGMSRLLGRDGRVGRCLFLIILIMYLMRIFLLRIPSMVLSRLLGRDGRVGRCLFLESSFATANEVFFCLYFFKKLV